jgi:hypothetical protein
MSCILTTQRISGKRHFARKPMKTLEAGLKEEMMILSSDEDRRNLMMYQSPDRMYRPPPSPKITFTGHVSLSRIKNFNIGCFLADSS